MVCFFVWDKKIQKNAKWNGSGTIEEHKGNNGKSIMNASIFV